MNKNLAALCLALAIPCVVAGGEAISFSGILQRQPAGQFLSSAFLRDANNGALLAGLRDPDNRLNGVGPSGRVTILAETTYARELDGLPIYRVVELLPEYWAQPWGRSARRPSNFSGPPSARAKDFAGTPATTYRSYGWDNGLDRTPLGLPDANEMPEPLRVMEAGLTARGFLGKFEAQAGLTYELHRVTDLGGAPETVSTMTVTVSGPIWITAPALGDSGFFLLRVRPTISN
jgi:hypothetical protein